MNAISTIEQTSVAIDDLQCRANANSRRLAVVVEQMIETQEAVDALLAQGDSL